MSAELHRLSGLHGANLEAFREAGDIVDAAMQPTVREPCGVCWGTGNGGTDTKGRARICHVCNGRGYIVTEAS